MNSSIIGDIYTIELLVIIKLIMSHDFISKSTLLLNKQKKERGVHFHELLKYHYAVKINGIEI